MSGFEVGQTVQLNDGGRLAIVRYAGQPDFAPGEWIGVELEDESGKNDGSVKGQRYFDCDMGRGMFLRPTAVKIIEQPAPKAKAPLAKRLSRPSSVTAPDAARRMSSVPDAAAGKRMSINASSPSPAVRARPSSIIRVSTPENHQMICLTQSLVANEVPYEATICDFIQSSNPKNWYSVQCSTNIFNDKTPTGYPYKPNFDGSTGRACFPWK
jgi:hypothetical protein